MKKEKCFATLVLCWCLCSSLWVEVYAESRRAEAINHEPYPKRSKSSSDSEQSNFEGSNDTEESNLALSGEKEDKRDEVSSSNAEQQNSEPRANSTEVSTTPANRINNLISKLITKITKRLSATAIKSFYGGIQVLKNFLIDSFKKFFKNCFWYEIGFVNNCIWYYGYKAIQLPIKYALKAAWGMIKTSAITALTPIIGPGLIPLVSAWEAFSMILSWAPTAYNTFTRTYGVIINNAETVLQLGLKVFSFLTKILGLGRK